MDMKNNIKKMGYVLLTFSITILFQASAYAQEGFPRRNNMELYFFVQMMGESDTHSDEMTITIGDMTAFGACYGYQFSDHFGVNMDLYFTSADINGMDSGTVVSGNSTIVGYDITLDFFLLKTRFTPLLTGGIGKIWFIGDVEGWPFLETDFSYNTGGGVMWNVTDALVLKATYRTTWTTLKDTSKALELGGYNFSVGYKF